MVLIDKYNRSLDLVEIQASQACQYDCAHCRLIKSNSPEKEFATNNILSFIRIMTSLGLKRASLGGGEALLRPDIIELVHGLISENPSLSVSLATNGKLLYRFARNLEEAGLKTISLSLPTLDRSIFKSITVKDDFDEIMESVEATLNNFSFEITIKMTILPGINDHEIEAMVDWAVLKGINIYLVEGVGQGVSADITEEKIRERLAKKYLLTRMTGTAKANNPWSLEGYETKLKIITRGLERECKTCNRMWLGPNGILKLCSELPFSVDLNELFENDPTQSELIEFAAKIVLNKPLGIGSEGLYKPLRAR